MGFAEFMTQARDAMTVQRVFADPYDKDGVTVIPAAIVAGGGGGGGGRAEPGQEGEGGGFGMTARPAGAYVITGGRSAGGPRSTSTAWVPSSGRS